MYANLIFVITVSSFYTHSESNRRKLYAFAPGDYVCKNIQNKIGYYLFLELGN